MGHVWSVEWVSMSVAPGKYGIIAERLSLFFFYFSFWEKMDLSEFEKKIKVKLFRLKETYYKFREIKKSW